MTEVNGLKKLCFKALCAAMCLATLVGCGGTEGVKSSEIQGETVFLDQVVVDAVEIEEEAVALSEAPAGMSADGTSTIPDFLEAKPTGVQSKKNNRVAVDYSNTADGYVMVNFTGETAKRLKVQVTGPTSTYTYNLTPKMWTVFPLSDGNGAYQVKVFENVSANKYSVELAVSMDVTLKDEFAPFIRANQYVNYSTESKIVSQAETLTKNLDTPLKKVGAIYSYVVKNITYDKEKAASVTSGYLPVLDEVLESKKGICFDYAALMTGMLRSQGIPCKLVVGYAGTSYHAWISVWVDGIGWVENAIYFDGSTWQRMDPTFASSGNQSKEIMAYIGDGKNYSAKYLY